MGTDTRRVSRIQRRTALKLGVAATVAAAATASLPGLKDHAVYTASPAARLSRALLEDLGPDLRQVSFACRHPRTAPPRSPAIRAGRPARRPGDRPDRVMPDMGAPGDALERDRDHPGIEGADDARSYRMMALVNVAIADAMIAAWDSKYAHNPDPWLSSTRRSRRPSPPREARPIRASTPWRPGAASTVLAYLFPDDAPRFAELAQEAASSRVRAGVQFPSDVAAGLEPDRLSARRSSSTPRRTALTRSGQAPFPKAPVSGSGPTRASRWPAPGSRGCSPPATSFGWVRRPLMTPSRRWPSWPRFGSSRRPEAPTPSPLKSVIRSDVRARAQHPCRSARPPCDGRS